MVSEAPQPGAVRTLDQHGVTRGKAAREVFAGLINRSDERGLVPPRSLSHGRHVGGPRAGTHHQQVVDAEPHGVDADLLVRGDRAVADLEP